MNDVCRILEKLETIQQWAGVGAIHNGIAPQNCEDVAQWIGEAIELLKENKPRLLTLEEVKARSIEEAHDQSLANMWFEEVGLTGSTFGMMQTLIGPLDKHWQSVLLTSIGDREYSTGLYNVRKKGGWRCWTSQPTNEQLRMEKWKT